MYNTYTAHSLVSKAHYTIQPSDWLELSIISPTPAYLGLSEPLVGLAEGNLSSIRAWPRLIFLNIRVIYNYLWRGRTWVSKPSEELKLIMNVRTTPARALGLLPPVTGGKPSERSSLWIYGEGLNVLMAPPPRGAGWPVLKFSVKAMFVWFPARPQPSLYLFLPLVEAHGKDVSVDPETVLKVHLSAEKWTLISVRRIIGLIWEPFRRGLGNFIVMG